jgi:hypothetical protein
VDDILHAAPFLGGFPVYGRARPAVRAGYVDGVEAGAACDEPVELLDDDSAAGLAAVDSDEPDDELVEAASVDDEPVVDEPLADEPVRASFL